MNIKVAVASDDKMSMDGHAGKCQNYFIYEIDDKGNYTKELKELAKKETLRYTFHSDKSENPTNFLFGMDIILVTEIGQGGAMKLANQGVKALIVRKAETTDEVVDQLIAGTLDVFEPQPHDHNHDHGHHHH